MEILSKHRTLLIGLAGLGAAVAVTWLFMSRRKKMHVRKVGQISQLFLYPVKSCKGIPLQEAECRDYGLKYGELSDRVHGNEVLGRDCGDEASRWITNYLKNVQIYRLVQFEDRMKRRNPKKEYPTYTENDQVAYPDLSPLLLLSDASLEDLNSKLEHKVSIRNFRPNIVVSGCEPFAEDSWKEIQIGEHVRLKQVMPCPRCILTTVDPDTGIINMKEPLETMRSYRLCDTEDKKVYKSSPLFGQFVRIQKKGMIKVGDPVYEIF
ncbi:mitochondrial amidoxime reducing component 2-like isoform X2 [Lithobates pipiens]